MKIEKKEEIDKTKTVCSPPIDTLESRLYSTQKVLKNDYKVSANKQSKLVKVGRSYSYLFYRFAKWIAKDCEDRGIKKIYFFTREGEFYKQIFDIIKPKQIESEILEVSRVATFCASLREVSINELKRIWNLYSSQSMKALCKSLDIPLQKIEALLAKYHIHALEEIINPWQDERVKTLFKDEEFKEILGREISVKRELVLKYFKSKGLENKKTDIAIVDIGWRGTIQDNICYILPNCNIYGYYFALYEFLNEQPKNAAKYGFLNQFKGGTKFLANITPFEMICNSPNGSTICYREENGIHAVRKVDEQENRSYNKCISYVQKGIIEDIKEHHRDLNDDDNAKIFDILTNIIYKPNYEVARAYFNLKHNEEFGIGDYIYKKKKFHYGWMFLAPFSRKYRELFRESLINSTWSQGFLKINKLGILNEYYKRKFGGKGDI